MIITEEIRDKLRAPLPDEAIKQHPTKSFLSTIKAIYIVERLNDVFGIGGWDQEHEIISDTEDYVAVRGRILYDEHGHPDDGFRGKTPFQYGGHKKTGKNTEPADGYKSAVTDCMSKCASYLEIGIDVFKGLHGKKPPAPKKKPKAPPKENLKIPTPEPITRPQQNKLFAMMTDPAYDYKRDEAKAIYDWHLGDGEATKAWGTHFIENLKEIATRWVDHKIDSGEEIDA